MFINVSLPPQKMHGINCKAFATRSLAQVQFHVLGGIPQTYSNRRICHQNEAKVYCPKLRFYGNRLPENESCGFHSKATPGHRLHDTEQCLYMNISHFFHFKAFSRATIVQKRPFHIGNPQETLFFSTVFSLQLNKREAVIYTFKSDKSRRYGYFHMLIEGLEGSSIFGIPAPHQMCNICSHRKCKFNAQNKIRAQHLCIAL